MPLPENLSIGKVFNRYGNDFESEKEIRDLSIQQRKRNLMVVGFVVFGGVVDSNGNNDHDGGKKRHHHAGAIGHNGQQPTGSR